MEEKKFFTEPFNTVSITGVPEPRPLVAHSLVSASDERLFLSDVFNHRIIVIDAEGRHLNSFGGKGGGPGQFWYPHGLAIIDTGQREELWVCDSWNHRIGRFGLEGDFLGAFGSIGEGDGQFNEPVALFPDGEGGAWILDRCNHRIKRHSPDGSLISKFGKRLNLYMETAMVTPEDCMFDGKGMNYGFNYPMSFAPLTDGTFLVADTNKRRLCQVTDTGELLRTVKLDVEGAPPYTYPCTVTSLGHQRAIVGKMGGSYLLICLERPWRRIPTGLISDPASPHMAVATRIGPQGPELIVADGAKGILSRYLFSSLPETLDEKEERDFLPDFPDNENIETIPNRWTELDQERWSLYLDSFPTSEVSAELVQAYISTCVATATAAAQKLSETEGELCKIVATHYEASQALAMKRLQNANTKETDIHMVRQTLLCSNKTKRRLMLRAALVQNIAGVSRLLSGRPFDERAEFLELLKSEYEQHIKSVAEIENWLKDRLANTQNLSIQAVVHAFTALFFIDEHLNYLSKAFKLLNPSHVPSAPDILVKLKVYFNQAAGDPRIVATNVLLMTGRICARFGYYDTMCALFQKFMNQATGLQKIIIALQYYDFQNRMMASRSSMASLLVSVADEVQIESQAILVVAGLQATGAFAEAQTLIDRFEPEKTGEMTLVKEWGRKKVCQNMADLPEPVLSAGQRVDQLSGVTNAGGLRYNGSIEVLHPKTGNHIRPWRARVFSTSELIIQDIENNLFLFNTSKGARLLWQNHEQGMNCLEVINAANLLFSLHDPFLPYRRRALKSLQVETGEVSDFSPSAGCVIPDNPLGCVVAGNGTFVMYEVNESELSSTFWLVEDNFRKSRKLFTLNSGWPLDICVKNDQIAITFWEKSAIYRSNLITGEGSFFPADQVIESAGVAMDDLGALYVCAGGGLGLIYYDKSGKPFYRITTLEENEERYDIACSKLILTESTDKKFEGADILMADHVNQRVHLFSL